MPRQIFKNRRIATAGPLPGQLTVDNLKRWTTIRKGYFSDELDDSVTHLLCTREQFHARVPRVQEGLRRGKRFHIVHYDWFEFSTVEEKRQPEREYSMRNILAKQNAKRREEARIEKGRKDAEKFVNTNFFHLYIDRDFFPYQIDLVRDNQETGQTGQKYTLCLWESDAKPHLYWFTAKFLKKRGDSQPSYYRPSECCGKWRAEMDHFMDFFRIKTGIAWEDRVLKEGLTSPREYFQYAPPRGGKPVGRRLRFDYEYCRQINAELRGLPWPRPEDSPPTEEHTGVDAPMTMEDVAKDAQHDFCEEEEHGNVLSSDGNLVIEDVMTGLESTEPSPHEESPEEQGGSESPTASFVTSPSLAAASLDKSPLSTHDGFEDSGYRSDSVTSPEESGEDRTTDLVPALDPVQTS